MTNLTKLFDYNGSKITFRNDEGVAFVNATQMAKPFGASKQPVHWMKLNSSNEYLQELSKLRNLSLTDLVKVKRGGVTPGTWMHEDVAIEFSRWLSPAFAIWCNDRIKELLTTGTTSLPSVMPTTKQLAQMVIDAENAREKAEIRLAEVMPRFDYVEKVFNSNGTFNANEIAQDFGMSAVALNKKLHELGVQYKQGKIWMLYAQHRNRGLTKQITMMRNEKPVTHTVWTERGRAFIHSRLNPEMKMSIAKRDESLYRIDNPSRAIN